MLGKTLPLPFMFRHFCCVKTSLESWQPPSPSCTLERRLREAQSDEDAQLTDYAGTNLPIHTPAPVMAGPPA